jgi:hypothetical protein
VLSIYGSVIDLCSHAFSIDQFSDSIADLSIEDSEPRTLLHVVMTNPNSFPSVEGRKI